MSPIPFVPEKIFGNETTVITRAMVIDGWLVSTTVNGPRGTFSVNTNFIFDAGHTWEVE